MSMSGHQSAKPKTETWFSPPAIVEALGGAESFDLDPASHTDRPWDTARSHYTKSDNGLALPWFGRVWLNPPYSTALIQRFMARMAAHNCGVALIFARTETDSFFDHVWQRASGVLFLRGRLHFHVGRDTYFKRKNKPPALVPAGGRAPANGGAPSVLISYGQLDRDILAAAPIDGHFAPLNLPLMVFGNAPAPSWRKLVADYLKRQNGPVHLSEMYRALARHPKAIANSNFPAKIRQSLQRGAGERVEKGVWRAVA